MRIRVSKFAAVFIALINLLLFAASWKLFAVSENEPIHVVKTPKPRDKILEANKFIKESLTVVFRDFFHFDNDLKASIDHLLKHIVPDLNIFVLSDSLPYPPINIFTSSLSTNLTAAGSSLIYKDNVKFFALDDELNKATRCPLKSIQTKFVLFMPDSFRLSNGRQLFQRLIRSLEHESRGRRRILVIPFASTHKDINYCFQISMDVPNWTLEFETKNSTANCNLFTQKHALLLETALLSDFLDPFAPPFPEYFYFQAKIGGFTLEYSNETMQDGKRLMTSFQSRTSRKSLKKNQFETMYKKLQFKKVVKKFHVVPQKSHQKRAKKNRKGKGDKGGDNSWKYAKDSRDLDILIEPLEISPKLLLNQSLSSVIQMKTDNFFYGCEKNTKSCIGQIYGEKPFFLYLNRHMPPCCLDKLKTVFHYLIEELENTGIRYWLDNSALKDAIELNGLSNDTFEIDISFNVNDYNRSRAMKRCFDSRPFTDLAGYYWIKATDGQYLKVQFSKTNDVRVNLLPFELLNDKMIPKGFYGPKAKEFSVDFLHPMSSLLFLGKNVFAPNNAPSFLASKGFKLNEH